MTSKSVEVKILKKKISALLDFLKLVNTAFKMNAIKHNIRNFWYRNE